MKFISILLLFITTAWLAACSHESKHEAHVGRVYDSLSGSLPLDPLNGQVITSLINKKNDTMAVLYGNDTAVAFARTNHSGIYPSGARLYLLTWQEKEDAYWFGARVPENIVSMECVYIAGMPVYEKYSGHPLTLEKLNDEKSINERVAYIMQQRASIMP